MKGLEKRAGGAGGAGRAGGDEEDEEDKGVREELITNAQCPIPNPQSPITVEVKIKE